MDSGDIRPGATVTRIGVWETDGAEPGVVYGYLQGNEFSFEVPALGSPQPEQTGPAGSTPNADGITTAPIQASTMSSGDPVFAGYPLLVDVGTLDERVQRAFEGQLAGGQVVALAPGVYTPYNELIPDLGAYLDLPSDGDCAMRERYFPNTGGSCWTGVQPGTAEPAG